MSSPLRAEVKQFQHELERQARGVSSGELMRKAYRIAELEYRVDPDALRQKWGCHERSLSWQRITKPLRIARNGQANGSFTT